MAFKFKTLIVFDTNALRSTEAGEVAYSFFAFGQPYQRVEEFIETNHLTDDIHLAIPAWAIEELKDQKQRRYYQDVIEFQKLATRLSGMPHIGEVTLPENDFDCVAYIEQKSTEFLATKSLHVMNLPDELAGTVLQNMMKRVMKDERVKHPFVHAKRGKKTYKDAGFKDNLIWESLMHFEKIEEYDKVIFLTGDSDYANCQEEFTAKWSKHFTIVTDENNAIAEINRDYELYIEEREIYDFSQSEYFKDYLFDILKEKSEVVIDDQNFKIENFEIVDTCASVERMPPDDEFEENVIIHSTIKVHYTDGAKKEIEIDTTTTLADEVSRDISETNFEIDLI
jgi:hypothetical protein